MGYADQIDLSDCGFVTRKTSLELDLDVTLVNFPITLNGLQLDLQTFEHITHSDVLPCYPLSGF